MNFVRKQNYSFLNKNNKIAGRDFVAGFLTRHSNVSLRKPEAISLNRVYGLNKVSVDKYFENLAKVLDTYNLEQKIFNLDESRLLCVHKPNKVSAQSCVFYHQCRKRSDNYNSGLL